MDTHALNEELSMFCKNLLSKYKALKNKSVDLKEKNKNLFSKLHMILQERVEISSERDSLKTQLDFVLKENEVLKNKNDCDDVLKKNEVLSSRDKHLACSTSSSINNDICMMKKSVDCLSSTLSQCVMNHKRLESMFRKNVLHLYMHIIHGIHMLLMFTHMTPCMIECTLVHIVVTQDTLQNFVMID